MLTQSLRKAQVKELFATLRSLFKAESTKHHKTLLSLGCGYAPECTLNLAAHAAAIDHNKRIIEELQRTQVNTKASEGEAIAELQKQSNKDIITVLDIDTNIPITTLIQEATKKITDKGFLLITERENNVQIYGRLLLKPHLKRIETMIPKTHQALAFERRNHSTDPFDRDNIILIITRRENIKAQATLPSPWIQIAF